MSKKKKNRLTNIILVVILLVGLSLLLYPSVSDYWNSFHQTRAIMRYMEDVGGMDTEDFTFDIVKTAKDILSPAFVSRYDVLVNCHGSSLNASNAAAVLMYGIRRARTNA